MHNHKIIREEWKKAYWDKQQEPIHPFTVNETADWWLSKLDQILKEREDKLRTGLTKLEQEILKSPITVDFRRFVVGIFNKTLALLAPTEGEK